MYDLANLPHNGQPFMSTTNPMEMVQYIREYVPAGVTQRIDGGNSCNVGSLAESTVLRYPLIQGELMSSLAIEHQILTALGNHKRIIQCFSLTEDGLILKWAKEGSLSSYLTRTDASMISFNMRLKWSQQATEAVEYIHSRGVIHCDIHPNNLLLDTNLEVILADFQGTYKELDGYAMEGTRFYIP
jgi:serine/threonine protein kinase